MSSEFLWYIPNTVEPGHRGDTVTDDHHSLDVLTAQAEALERTGWTGALLGTGWGRPDTFTLATALAARTRTFEPLIAVRPGYWRPANFASSVATLDHLTGGRVRVNVVSGKDDLGAYGDSEGDQAQRYGRTKEFMQLVRRLWTEEQVTATASTSPCATPPSSRGSRRGSRPGASAHPTLYFGGASEAAERVAATEADVQLFWGEPLDGVRERIQRLRTLSEELGREHAPLQFGLRVTTFVRDTTEQAWAEAEARVAEMAAQADQRQEDSPACNPHRRRRWGSSGCSSWPRAARCSTTTSTRPRAVRRRGAGTTWLVGSPRDVARSLRRYQDLGITHFVLSDTPYLGRDRAPG